MQRYVYLFKEGSMYLRSSLGLKGSRLCEMARLGLPVPPGLVLASEACAEYHKGNRVLPPEVKNQLEEKLSILEKGVNQTFGGDRDPLLLSVRPGAEISMPGTIASFCNVGLTGKSVLGLAQRSGNELFAWGTYGRFVEEFAVGAMKLRREDFLALRKKQLAAKLKKDELSVEDIKALVDGYLKLVLKQAGRPFPDEPQEQLWMAINSLHEAWVGHKAVTYRRMNDLMHLPGCGLTIQKMVFGNLNNRSGSGTIYTRHPMTGEKTLYGEYLMNSQGEDLTNGRMTPLGIEGLQIAMPGIYEQLKSHCQELETHFQAVQGLQFTIENEKLYLLYSKNAKLGPLAAVKTPVDLVKEKIVSEAGALSQIYAPGLAYLKHQRINDEAKKSHKLLGRGIPGSIATATGIAMFDANKLEEMHKKGKSTILVTQTIAAHSLATLATANGFVTQLGGTSADSSVLVRARGKACVLSCPDLEIHADKKSCTFGQTQIQEGDLITVDALNGEVYEGAVPLVDVEVIPEYEQLLNWADGHKKLKVMVNADVPQDVLLGKKYGAEGIGLCKTEHMFNDPLRMKHMRRAILSENVDERCKALEELVHYHKEDFKALFKLMSGQPCVIRILDPPLHSFIPGDKKGQEELAAELRIPVDTIQQQHAKMAEYNPMLGLRGSRLAVLYPEIVEFQAKCLFEAALESIEEGLLPVLCIELPMISSVREFRLVKELIEDVAKETGARDKIRYKIGILLEIPRAALTADELAKEADFIHFGTNDLTQLTCGFSREDSEQFIDTYIDLGVYWKNPFVALDTQGVGELMKIGIAKARKAKKGTRFGISGKQAYDPASIKFCQLIGIDEISCPPTQVPVAKIAAAQAAIKIESS